ncbi:uncharacterized protein [Rutidosis leptorrhynchoides]|uniref:uncharacterized protein n=1 Tax=Rutidosis leptorrhynchoides TaxID=125765 RepID=UPI003A99222F
MPVEMTLSLISGTYWVLPKDFVFDVAGQLVKLNRYKVDKDNIGEKKSTYFELADASGEKVRCKLWGAHAEKLDDSLFSEYKKMNHLYACFITVDTRTGKSLATAIREVQLNWVTYSR